MTVFIEISSAVVYILPMERGHSFWMLLPGEECILRIDPNLKRHLLDNYSIGEHELEMLVDDISEYWNRSVQDFVVQRHGELQRSGYSNADIFSRIEKELPQRRFAAPPLSIRQIRRIIYG